jgi:hypothetical protein
VYQCCEVISGQAADDSGSDDGLWKAAQQDSCGRKGQLAAGKQRLGQATMRIGPRLVAKEAVQQRTYGDHDFHPRFCRVAAQAEELAVLFNNRLSKGGLPGVEVHFLQCAIFLVGSRTRVGWAAQYPQRELELRPAMVGMRWRVNIC